MNSNEETRSRTTRAHLSPVTTPAGNVSISVRGLRKTFRRAGGEEVRAIDGVDLDVAPGEMVVLLGPSGCGKTTLLRCVAGLEPPDEGTVELNGAPVAGPDMRSVPPEARQIGMMFQSYALWPHMTVLKNVAYPLESRKFAKGDIRRRVEEILRLVGIETLIDQHPSRLSGGQQQRVALARSLVAEPRVMLFDEPLSNVDAQVRSQLRHEIAEMQQELGFAGIYVTHDQEEAMELADRLAVMRSGQVAQIGAPREVYSRPTSRYVAQFVGDLNIWNAKPEDGQDPNHVCFDVEGLGRVVASRDSVVAMEDSRLMRSLMVRPESVNVLPITDADESERNVWKGTVRREIFGGAHTQYTVALDNGVELIAKTPRRFEASTEAGARVIVSIDPADLRVLPPEESSAEEFQTAPLPEMEREYVPTIPPDA